MLFLTALIRQDDALQNGTLNISSSPNFQLHQHCPTSVQEVLLLSPLSPFFYAHVHLSTFRPLRRVSYSGIVSRNVWSAIVSSRCRPSRPSRRRLSWWISFWSRILEGFERGRRERRKVVQALLSESQYFQPRRYARSIPSASASSSSLNFESASRSIAQGRTIRSCAESAQVNTLHCYEYQT